MPQFSLGPLLRHSVDDATKTTKLSPVSLAVPLQDVVRCTLPLHDSALWPHRPLSVWCNGATTGCRSVTFPRTNSSLFSKYPFVGGSIVPGGRSQLNESAVPGISVS
eukprot:1178882-Prorocentrum_minimum.AAC.2